GIDRVHAEALDRHPDAGRAAIGRFHAEVLDRHPGEGRGPAPFAAPPVPVAQRDPGLRCPGLAGGCCSLAALLAGARPARPLRRTGCPIPVVRWSHLWLLERAQTPA